VRGRAPDELDDGQLVQLGRLLARMHTVGAAHSAPARLRLDPDSFGASSLEALLATQWIPFELQFKYRTAVQKVLDAARPLWRDLPMHRIHGDCHLGNLLWNADGPFFLDFDDMVTGPAVQDVWMLVRGRDADADRQRERIIDGYAEMRGFDRTHLRLVEPLRALRIVHYSAWIASHWQDPAFPRVFPDFPSFDYWAREVEQLERVVGALFDPRTAPN